MFFDNYLIYQIFFILYDFLMIVEIYPLYYKDVINNMNVFQKYIKNDKAEFAKILFLFINHE
jgi:hypothetical protein